jgi:hypothetical protein
VLLKVDASNKMGCDPQIVICKYSWRKYQTRHARHPGKKNDNEDPQEFFLSARPDDRYRLPVVPL